MARIVYSLLPRRRRDLATRIGLLPTIVRAKSKRARLPQSDAAPAEDRQVEDVFKHIVAGLRTTGKPE